MWEDIIKADRELTQEYLDDLYYERQSKELDNMPIGSHRGMDEYVMPIVEKVHDLIIKELNKMAPHWAEYEQRKYSKEDGMEDLRTTILAILYGSNKRF